MLSNSGVNINDSIQVKNHLNIYYNAQFSYFAYQQVISNCATFAGSYVLPRKGTEADFVESAYRFGFQGFEADNEVSGSGNSYTAEYWQYDSRLGRRWNVDRVVKPWESSYAAFANNPIIYVDPLGLDVVNGDELRRQKAEGKVNELSTKVGDMESTYGNSRKDFKKNGGEDWKSKWKEYKTTKSELRSEKQWLAIYTDRSRQTQDIIDRWKIESPNTFKQANEQKNELGETVDFVLGVKNYTLADGHWGANNVGYIPGTNSSGGLIYRPWSSEFGVNKVTVFIHPNVRISMPDPETGQFSLNHEAGHFIYWTGNTTAYIQFRLQVASLGYDIMGGHAQGDLSGKKADEYGNVKDQK